jgi:molecular chaperone HtpG
MGMERDYIFGAFIIENLTTAMYSDSKVIYREYIQNACDQIDKAVALDILKNGEGIIEIWIDSDKRKITIEDNATGIEATKFRSTLGNVADSDKKIGKDKGFRGIGRLCGLAYCNQLVFTSTYKGENTISIMRCDAAKMREMISEHAAGKKHTANEVLQTINEFETITSDDITDAHYFKVELLGINDENRDLLDEQLIKDYLSFVAPVPYQNSFIFRSEIYNHAKNIGQRMDEYKVKLEGGELFKQYKTHVKTRQGQDDVFGVDFKEFSDQDDNLLMWLWYGKTRVPGQMTEKDNPMRCLRLRKDNIQIGDEDTLKHLFNEERFNGYFIGEVFAVSKNLIPDGRRNYFNENQTRLTFENSLRMFFKNTLAPLCRVGSDLNAAYRKIDALCQKREEFVEKEQRGDFVDELQRQTELEKVEVAKQTATEAREKIERLKTSGDDNVVEIINRIETERTDKTDTVLLPEDKYDDQTKPKHRSDRLARLSRNERKLVSRIYGIIFRSTDSVTAETIVKNIEEELK